MKQTLLLKIIFLIYTAVVLISVFNHEPWRDEAHVWNSAREDTLVQIIENTRYTPMPTFWTILVRIFASSGFPYISMNIIHASIAITAVGMLLFFSPLPILLKIGITFSYYYIYEYAVIARPYVLTIAILHFLALCYRDRLKRPVLYSVALALLFQTTFYSFLPAIILSLYFCIDVIRTSKFSFQSLLSIGIIVCVMAFTLLNYIPTPSVRLNEFQPINPMLELGSVIQDAITPSLISKIPGFNSPEILVIIRWITLGTFITYMVSIIRKTKLLLLFIVTYIWLVGTNIFLHAGTIRHHGLLLVYFLYFLWMSPGVFFKKSATSILQTMSYGLLCILSVFSIFVGIYITFEEYQYNFSGANDMSRYIQTHNLQSVPTILYTAFDGESILPYFDKKPYWYPELREFDRYHINDSRYIYLPRFTSDEVKNSIDKYFPYKKNFLILTSDPYLNLSPDYTLLHTSMARSFWSNDTESFWLYQRTK